MKIRKSCWTCTARKIQCDGALPACKKCAQAHRECRGYEMRLSWPKNDDKKRAIVSHAARPALRTPNQVPTKFIFLNTAWEDVELYNHPSLQLQLSHLVPSSANIWKQPETQESHMDLVSYFYDSAYLSLVTFGGNYVQLRDALLSMTVVHDAAPGLALVYALLAFSSLHRNGLHKQAVQLKILAIHFLSASLKDGPLVTARAMQHAAASMLLGAFEILLPSEGSGEWLWYVWGAMDIIQATHLKDETQANETCQLLDWVYYHDSLSHFTVHHWRPEPVDLKRSYTTIPDRRNSQHRLLARYRPVVLSPNPNHAILNLLSEICSTLVDSMDPRSQTEEYQSRLKHLQSKVDEIAVDTVSTKSNPDDAFVLELYHTSTRIYLARASKSEWGSPNKLNSLVDSFFSSAICEDTCGHFFPLFILACEARRDEQRVAILNLLDRTERDRRIRSVQVIKKAIQAIWVQQDLTADNDLLMDYSRIISSVISSSKTAQSFV